MTGYLRLGEWIAAIVLLAAGATYMHHKGYEASESRWTAKWAARDAADAKALATFEIGNAAAEAAHKAKDEVIVHDLQTAIDRNRGRADDLARRLRLAAAHDSCAVPAGPQAATGADAPGTGDRGAGDIERATSDLIAACTDAAATLTALQQDVAGDEAIRP